MIIGVGNDYGGNVEAYAVYERYLAEQGAEVRFSGPCASACTILLAVPKGCATEKAEFQFHAASSRPGTDLMLGLYPDWLQKWIADRGGLTANWLYLRVPEVFKYIQRCTP